MVAKQSPMMRSDTFAGIRILWIIVTIMLAVGIAGGIAYGGGFHNVYVAYASWEAYLITGAFLLSLYGLWRTRHR